MSNKRPRVLPTKRAIEKLYSQIDEEVDQLLAPILNSPPPSPPTHRLCIRSERTVDEEIRANIRAMEADDREAIEIADLRKHACLMERYRDDEDSSSSIPLNQPNQEDIDNALAWISQRSSAGNENDGYLATELVSSDDGEDFLESEPEDLPDRGIYGHYEIGERMPRYLARLRNEEAYRGHVDHQLRYVDGQPNRRGEYERDEILSRGRRGWLVAEEDEGEVFDRIERNKRDRFIVGGNNINISEITKRNTRL